MGLTSRERELNEGGRKEKMKEGTPEFEKKLLPEVSGDTVDELIRKLTDRESDSEIRTRFFDEQPEVFESFTHAFIGICEKEGINTKPLSSQNKEILDDMLYAITVMYEAFRTQLGNRPLPKISQENIDSTLGPLAVLKNSDYTHSEYYRWGNRFMKEQPNIAGCVVAYAENFDREDLPFGRALMLVFGATAYELLRSQIEKENPPMGL